MDTATWYYAAGDGQHGPHTAEQIQGLLRDRVVDRNTLVWSPALSEWTPLGRTELASLLAAPVPPPRPTPPRPPQTTTARGPSVAPAGSAGGPLSPVAAGQPGGFDLGAMEQGAGFPGVMIRAARTVIQDNYVNFQGRTSRPGYWWYVLFAVILAIVTSIIDSILRKIIGFGFTYFLLVLALFLPGLGAGVRRLHDTNRSGWWLLVPIVPIIFLCLPGDQGDNRFGPPPRPV